MNVADHKCSSCGAPLNYNTEKQLWYCNYCKKSYKLEDLKENIKKIENTPTNSLEEYECPNCGAKVLTSSTTSSTVCIYCGNSVIIKKRVVKDYHPDFIIPFINEEDNIINLLFDNIDPMHLCPKDFKNRNNISRIARLYVPYWLVSCEVMGSIKGIVYTESDNSSTNLHYRRLGVMKLNSIPIKAKSNIPPQVLNGIEPFNFENAKKFEYPYLAGMWAESYDISKDDVEKSELKNVIEDNLIYRLLRTVTLFPKDYPPMEKSVFKSNYSFNYILLPVWFIVMKYNNRDYYYCVNDQTGKVEGETPINNKKMTKDLALQSLIIMSVAMILFAVLNIRLFVLLGLIGVILIVCIYNNKVRKKYFNVEKETSIEDYINKADLKILDSNDVYD